MTNQEIIEKIKKWQNNEFLHPLTCGNNSNHKILIPKEIDNKVILICEDCDYTQTFIPKAVFKIDTDEYSKKINNFWSKKEKD